MKYCPFIFIVFLLAGNGCKENVNNDNNLLIRTDQPFVIPSYEIDKTKLTYDRFNSLWLLNGQHYSGYTIVHFDTGVLKEKIGILNGRKQNESLTFFPDGSIRSSSLYYKGKLHGEKKSWSSDSSHVLVSQLNYHLGKVHGIQKKWYPTGEIFKVMNLNMGKEEGLQQAFRKNGVLYANYEAKNGRIFGLKKSALCYGIEDENIQYEK